MKKIFTIVLFGVISTSVFADVTFRSGITSAEQQKFLSTMNQLGVSPSSVDIDVNKSPKPISSPARGRLQKATLGFPDSFFKGTYTHYYCSKDDGVKTKYNYARVLASELFHVTMNDFTHDNNPDPIIVEINKLPESLVGVQQSTKYSDYSCF